MSTISIPRPRGFRLRSALDFYAQFVPGSGMAAESASGLTLAFRLDRTFEAAAVRVDESEDALTLTVGGTTKVGAAAAQVSRILGLEADADAWARAGERDEVVARLKAEFPGFFTAAKPSPYDAATWAVLVPRMPMRRAAAIKLAMTRELGARVTVAGESFSVFPEPAVLAKLRSFPGVPEEKMERLRGVARAAEDGLLDADTLRAMPEPEALARLQRLRGVGPWAASHIYHRGAAPIDALPMVEPRVLHGLAHLLGEREISPEAYVARAERWRPFRMWVAVLLSRHLARTAGWRAPSIAVERERAGRALARRTRAA